MEYYLAMRKNEIWPFVATWMELEGIMLSEISQAEKDRYHIWYHIYHMWILRNLMEDHGGRGRGKKLQRGSEASHKKLLNAENKLRVDGGWGRGESG